jgi:hypothetical protein
MLAAFPDAELHTPPSVQAGAPDADAAAPPVEDDDWDPFDPISEEN